jgi:hypothetical protein
VNIKRTHIDISYPEVKAVKRSKTMGIINSHIKDKVCTLLQRQDVNQNDFDKILGNYRITLNRRGVLSIFFEYCSTKDNLKDCSFVLSSMNVSLVNGNLYTLRDLFKEEGDYASRIYNYISVQMENRSTSIQDRGFILAEDGFYITDEGIVVYPAPDSSKRDGIFQFLIPYIYLIDIIEERGPLAKILI